MSVKINLTSTKALYKRFVKAGLKPDDIFLKRGEIRFWEQDHNSCYRSVSVFQTYNGRWSFANGKETCFWPISEIPNDCKDIDRIFDWAIEQLKTIEWVNVPGTTKFKPRNVYPVGEQQELCL